MLTPKQLRHLREHVSVTGNRVALAIALAEMTQMEVADATGLSQPYISAVVRAKHGTVTVENARKFAAFFGCSIEDLFPARQAVAS